MEKSELFALGFAEDNQRLAVGGYSECGPTSLGILDSNNHYVHKIEVAYPVTGIQWCSQLLATTSERLRIYNESLQQIWCVSASSTAGPPPLTSLDWNKHSTQWILTSSVDTTCTLWDLAQQKPTAHTRLIAHDAEVLDVKFLAGSTSLFGSCSTDGSLRLFDLRNLNQSTIAYEPAITDKVPLLRLSVCESNPNYIALVEANSPRVIVVDLRNVGVPLTSINCMDTVVSTAWHPHSGDALMTATEHGGVLLYDINHNTLSPNMVFKVAHDINCATWSPHGDVVATATQQGVCRVRF